MAGGSILANWRVVWATREPPSHQGRSGQPAGLTREKDDFSLLTHSIWGPLVSAESLEAGTVAPTAPAPQELRQEDG